MDERERKIQELEKEIRALEWEIARLTLSLVLTLVVGAVALWQLWAMWMKPEAFWGLPKLALLGAVLVVLSVIEKEACDE